MYDGWCACDTCHLITIYNAMTYMSCELLLAGSMQLMQRESDDFWWSATGKMDITGCATSILTTTGIPAEDVMHSLLAASAQIDKKDKQGVTPLYSAPWYHWAPERAAALFFVRDWNNKNRSTIAFMGFEAWGLPMWGIAGCGFMFY